MTYQERETHAFARERIVVYSDGLIDALNLQGESSAKKDL